MQDPNKPFIERAYLEAARSFFHANIVDSEGNKTGMSRLTMWALVSISYSMSYTAMVAFSTIQLSRYWNNGVLRKKYPKANSFTELLGNKQPLGTLKKSLKILCDCVGKERIPAANRTLWEDLTDVVENYRHYAIHPKPDREMFQKFVKDTMDERPWEFAPRVASEIIGYFYGDPDSPRNDWLRENQDFIFPTIKIIKPRS